MKPILESLARILLFVLILAFWSWLIRQPYAPAADLIPIVGGPLLMLPIAWLGRRMLDRDPTPKNAERTTAIIHYLLVFLLGASVFRVVGTYRSWPEEKLPIPPEIGLVLVVLSGTVLAATVANLAWKGLGAPFAVALSRRLATDWMYAYTRNPMVLATLAFLFSAGLWIRSGFFLLWMLLLITPVWLWLVKVFEERELEIRFGSSYREYKSKTPMLFPRRPKP
jgi:protein-S-isoprenylcysteine O-methyltransferase Ste14